jgi:hypothetical protein
MAILPSMAGVSVFQGFINEDDPKLDRRTFFAGLFDMHAHKALSLVP